VVEPASSAGSASLAGQLVGGRFRILYAIAAGGMGAVYEARDEQLGRRVAIKVIRPELLGDPVARARFRREALATAAVTHPGLVTLHDVALDGDPAYFVMELIDGQTLDNLLHREARLFWPRALRLALDVLDALEALHAAGIVHRDVKPSNLMVVGEGDRERCRLIDLGVARLLTAPADDARTASGVAVGTPAYMAPEQFAGERVGPTVDVYAMGLVLYKSLTGAHPYSSSAVTAEGAGARGGAIEPVHALARDVPPAVSALVETMIARSPARRPASAAHVARTIRELLARSTAGAPMATERLLAALDASSPGASEPGALASPRPDMITTQTGPAARTSLPSSAQPVNDALLVPSSGRVLARIAVPALAVLVLGATAWLATGWLDEAPPPTPVTSPEAAPTTSEDTQPLPRGVDPTSVPIAPEPRTTPARERPAPDPARVEAAAPAAEDPRPVTPVDTTPAHTTPAHTTPAHTTPGTTEPTDPPPLPSSPGSRPATRVRVQYLGMTGRSDGAAVSAELEPRLLACIVPSQHYANRTLASTRVTIGADGTSRELLHSIWAGTDTERACVERAIRATHWPAGPEREIYVRMNPLL
jgi:serine/threonine protein kinase